VNRVAFLRSTEYQTAWIWRIRWIIFNDFAVQRRIKDFVQRQIVFASFLPGVLCDVDAVSLNGVDYIRDFHFQFSACNLIAL